MRPFIHTLILFFSLTIPLMLYANDSEELQDEGHVEYLKYDKNKKRKELPSRVFIECHYTEKHLRFVLPTFIKNIHVSIGDEEAPVWQTWVTNFTPECDIPKLIGEYEITCRTDGNQIFKGKLYFY